MLETICRSCGERYPLGQEHRCKPAKKSERVAKPPKQAESDDNSQPVSRSDTAESSSGRTSGFGPENTGSMPVSATKRGRPRLHPDRKAYKALKAKEYRARKKAAKSLAH